MQKDIYERIISFLLGASWAIVLFGALLTFKLFMGFGVILALFLSIFYTVFALFFVLALDAFMVNKDRLKEAKKQTQLLEKLTIKTEN
jgi:hypothetical protein